MRFFGIFSWLFMVLFSMYAYGNLVQRYSSILNTRVNDVHSIGVAPVTTAIDCCAFCSVTDTCVSSSFQASTGSCMLANINPILDSTSTISEAGWMAFYKPPCLPSWTLWQSHCYFFQAANTYQESEASCLSLGGHLVDVQSQGENDFLISFKANVSFWIGLNDLSTEGNFRWTLYNAPPTFTRYYPGQPNGGTNENCIAMLPSDRTWWDEPCFGLRRSICKKNNLLR